MAYKVKKITISFKQSEEDLYNEIKSRSSPGAWLKDLAADALSDKQKKDSEVSQPDSSNGNNDIIDILDI